MLYVGNWALKEQNESKKSFYMQDMAFKDTTYISYYIVSRFKIIKNFTGAGEAKNCQKSVI